MATQKKENYTKEQEEFILATYNPEASQDERDAQVEAIVEKTGKTLRSVRGKLSSMNLYVKANPTSKVTGEKPAKKEEIAARLVVVAGVDGDGKALNAESLQKANKTDLQFLVNRLTEMQAEIDALQAELDA